MIDPIYIGRSGLRAQQQVVETISNNITNLNSVGFKRETAKLSTVIAAAQVEDPSRNNGAERGGIGHGVAISGIGRNMSQGQLHATSRPLDLAIQGAGFFVLQRENGDTVYARAGTFTVSNDGYLVDQSGNRLQPELQIEGANDNLVIDRNGSISSVSPEGVVSQMGQLELAYFQDPNSLTLDSSGVYLENEKSGQAVEVVPGQDGVGLVMQGYLENSNVNLVDEFTSLVMAQRAYEASAKVVQTAGDLFDTANALLRA